MKIEMTLTKAEAKAVLRSHGLTNGHGVVKSQGLKAAEYKFFRALREALEFDPDAIEREGGAS